jgi:subtilisin family serine protease
MKNIFAGILICLFTLSFAQKKQKSAPVSNEFEAGVVLFRVIDEYDVSRIPRTKDNSVNPALLPELTDIFEKYGIINLSRPALAFEHPVLVRIFRMQFSYTGGIDMLIEELEARKEIIKYAEKNPNQKPLFRPNDPFYGNINNANMKWYLDRIYAEGAWLIQQGTPNIKVAIVDNYIWGGHPDLNILPENLYDAYNDLVGDASPPSFAQEPSDTSYTNSHGTHVAGLVGAINNNNEGIASIGGGVTLMGSRVSANYGDVMYNSMQGVDWVITHGAKVVNMSYGSTYYQEIVEETFQAYADSGIVLVSSAGNDGDRGNPVNYPSCYSSVISVASIDGDEKLSYFSQYGANRADIAAPGGFINSSRAYPNLLSTTFCKAFQLANTFPSLANTYYDGMQGTSMSSPVVAGLCGLLLSFDSTLTPAQIKTLLQETASPLHPNSPTDIGGNGYVNAFAALMKLNENVPIFKASSQFLHCPYNEFVDSILVISHQAWTWTVIGDIPTWMNIAENNYYGNSKRLVFHLEKNFSIYPRDCELSLYCADLDSTFKIFISQVAHPETVDVDKKIIRINKGQNSISLLSITANVHWWMTGTIPSWLTVSDTTGDTSKIITFTAITENTDTSNRSYSFIISGNSVPDIQMEVIQDTAELFFEINKETLNLGASNTARDTVWISSNTDWVITGYDTNLVSVSPTSGSKDGYVVVRAKTLNSKYTPNITTGIFLLNGIDNVNIVIYQKPVDFLLLPETSFTLGYAQGSIVEVPVLSNISWAVYTANTASWISSNITEGQDSMTIVFTALSANETGKARSAKYNVKTSSSLKNITITQDFIDGPSNIIVNDKSEKELIQVYPNPVTNFINISTQKHLIKQVQILEILGNTVQTFSMEQPQTKIDCSSLAAGLYVLQITLNDNTVVTRKITKQ